VGRPKPGGPELISRAEAAALLGVSLPAVTYIAHVRRLLTPYRRTRSVLFSLPEVLELKDRPGWRGVGRPSGADLLRRRLGAAELVHA
jgi:hypothetical protein